MTTISPVRTRCPGELITAIRGATQCHAEPDCSFSVTAMVWRPGQVTPIHDHVTWCVLGVLHHRVRNRGDDIAISMHVYGADITRLGSSVRRTYDLPVTAPLLG